MKLAIPTVAVAGAAALLAAACGVIFWAWSALVYPLSQAVTVGYPPAGGLLVGAFAGLWALVLGYLLLAGRRQHAPD